MIYCLTMMRIFYRCSITFGWMKKSALLLLLVLGFHMLWSNNTSNLPEQRISLDADRLAYRSFLPIMSDMRFPGASDHIESIVLPLKRAGNLIMLEAIIDSIQGNLILDTGSAGFALNRMYFRQGRTVADQVSGGVTGSAGTVSTMRVNNMRIAELSFSRLEATIIDMGHIENARNVKILGFFGLVLFADYEVVIDLQNSVLELHRLNLRGNRVHRPNPPIRHDLLMTAKVNSNVVFIDAVINNSKLTFCLDTGAESNVLGSGLPGRVLNTVDITGRSTLRGAGAQQVEVLYGKMNDFSIERKEIKGMNVIITNLNAMSHFYGIPTHGMLGCEFLEKGTFFINLKQERLGIIFNKEDRK
jgi:hypothetical protein